MPLPSYATSGQKLWYWTFRFLCGLIFVFLIAPILIIVPLSFNAEPYFSFTEGMLSFDREAYSTRWYADILRNGMTNPDAPASWGGYFGWVWESFKAGIGVAPAPVPRKVAMSVAKNPIKKLFFIARTHCAFCHISL